MLSTDSSMSLQLNCKHYTSMHGNLNGGCVHWQKLQIVSRKRIAIRSTSKRRFTHNLQPIVLNEKVSNPLKIALFLMGWRLFHFDQRSINERVSVTTATNIR